MHKSIYHIRSLILLQVLVAEFLKYLIYVAVVWFSRCMNLRPYLDSSI